MDIHSGPYALLAAFILDFLIGDPHFLPHPIRWMGTAIEKAEPEFRKFVSNPFFAGLLFAISLITATWFAAWLCLFIAFKIHPSIKYFMEIIMIYYAISANSLETEAKKIYNLLIKEDTGKARQNLAMIVGRDVEGLSKEEISRAAIETVAENLVDGFISPMFFAVLGGAPLAMAYKMVNTLDSMVGYKNKNYIDFGKAAARIDDIANYIPARISIFIISFASQLMLKQGMLALKTAITQGANHTSPNAGYSEAAFAGCLDIRLGGPNYYSGRLVQKPWIGTGSCHAAVNDIKKACDLMLLSSFLWFAILWGCQIFIIVFF